MTMNRICYASLGSLRKSRPRGKKKRKMLGKRGKKRLGREGKTKKRKTEEDEQETFLE